ncbi:hypothetical protein WR25_05659 [Diploscapter pachys]|uniref:Uncharacterized protein n=1 Tax=Diploscapter pachys TaxID=2018661 RepID=A0A2A2LVD2_9BILA|nr:hypothetical protein WR25_05659 [Diploscapter pachys]
MKHSGQTGTKSRKDRAMQSNTKRGEGDKTINLRISTVSPGIVQGAMQKCVTSLNGQNLDIVKSKGNKEATPKMGEKCWEFVDKCIELHCMVPSGEIQNYRTWGRD